MIEFIAWLLGISLVIVIWVGICYYNKIIELKNQIEELYQQKINLHTNIDKSLSIIHDYDIRHNRDLIKLHENAVEIKKLKEQLKGYKCQQS